MLTYHATSYSIPCYMILTNPFPLILNSHVYHVIVYTMLHDTNIYQYK